MSEQHTWQKLLVGTPELIADETERMAILRQDHLETHKVLFR